MGLSVGKIPEPRDLDEDKGKVLALAHGNSKHKLVGWRMDGKQPWKGGFGGVGRET